MDKELWKFMPGWVQVLKEAYEKEYKNQEIKQ